MFWLNARKLLFRLVNNWPAKVLSVALALILVVFYRVGTLSTRTITVPLAVETNHALIPASAVPGNVRVTLRGEDDNVRLIADGDIEAFIDLSRHESEGWYRAPVQIRRRGTALEVEPLEISVNPVEVSLRLDRQTSALLRVSTPILGSPASGFDLVDHSINPGEIYVSGPASVLADITEIATSPVLVDGRNTDFSVAVNIINPSPLLLIRGETAAEFRGVVRPAVQVRNIGNVPITLTGLAPGLIAEIGGRTGSVRLEGNREQIDAFAPPPGMLWADASGVQEPGNHVIPVRITLPVGSPRISHTPVSLSLAVTREPEPEEEEPGSPATGPWGPLPGGPLQGLFPPRGNQP